ncbi:MAG: acetolactate synthase small subunit [Blastocatellia bacterium]|nr:acetolactate synthase small subunit [Blastocatellia bacterium]
MRRTLSILVENRYGELARIVGLFSARGFNIESLTVAETLSTDVSRVTLVTRCDDSVMEQIVKKLSEQVRVLEATDLTGVKHVEREMALLSVKAATKAARERVLGLVSAFRAEVVDLSDDGIIVEVMGDWDRINSLIKLLAPIGIREIARTGTVAMARSPEAPRSVALKV